MTKLSASLPEEHGLGDINDTAIAKPNTPFIVVGLVVPSKITKDLWKKREEATVAFESLEVLQGKDYERAQELLRAAYERRTGNVELPIDQSTQGPGNVTSVTFTASDAARLRDAADELGDYDPDTGELKED